MHYLIKKLNKKKNFILFIILFLLILSIKFNFFLNIYIILKNKTETRMISIYGHCYPHGYGFIEKVYLKYDLNNYNINTSNKNIAPTSNIFKFSFKNKQLQYEILINYSLSDLKKIKKKFKLVESDGDCHLIKYLYD